MPTMGIQESIDILKRAQEIDSEIHRFQQEIDSIPEILRHLTEEFDKEKARWNQLESDLKQTQLRQREKEKQLLEKEELIKKYDVQLMQVKTNKEYSALQQEMASLKADNSMIEDQILAILDEVDRIQTSFREEKTRLGEAERTLQEKKKELGERSEKLKADLDSLKQKRTEILSQVPPDTRHLYDKIIQKKEGLALVHAEGESCGACRIRIRPQVLNELKLKEALVVCENCSRILYVD